MMFCQNCGQINTQSSNFCRFCGTKFGVSQFAPLKSTFAPNKSNGSNFEYEPPRPYSWKTDEFQIPPTKVQPKPAPTRTINQVQPLAGFGTQPDLRHQPLQTYQTAAAASHNYRCPRCSSQLYPRVSRQISTGGWIVFAVLLVTLPFLFWIGLLIKEDVRVCSVCNLKID